jgi:hypothetical protein
MYPRVRLILNSKQDSRGRPRVSQSQIRQLLEKQPDVSRSKRPKLERRDPQPFRRSGNQHEQLRATAHPNGDGHSHEPEPPQEKQRRKGHDADSNQLADQARVGTSQAAQTLIQDVG